jgi:hypothetical protein
MAPADVVPGSRLRGWTQYGTELLRFSNSNAAWLLQNLQERCNFNVSAQKKEIPV